MSVDTRRLSSLMLRFGVDPSRASPGDNTTVQRDLRASFLRKACALHPDTGGSQDGREFIRLKEEHEEARKLLQSLQSTHPHSTLYRRQERWSQSAGHNAAPWDDVRGRPWPGENPLGNSREHPGMPPTVLLWFVGAGSLAWLVYSFLPSLQLWDVTSNGKDSSLQVIRNDSTSQFVRKDSSAQFVRKDSKSQLVRKDSSSQLVRKDSSEYYNKRLIKTKDGAMLAKRPHAKQRGLTHISPIHAAAEDGMAEWLHWAGERSRESVCHSIDNHQQTPLHYAARAGQMDACAVLLKFQASPGAVDSRGKTALDLAREGQFTDLVRMLEQGPPGPLASVQFRQPRGIQSQNIGICG